MTNKPQYWKGKMKPRKYIKDGSEAAKVLGNLNKGKKPYAGIGADSNANKDIVQMEKAGLIKTKSKKIYPYKGQHFGTPVRRTYEITPKGKKVVKDIKKKGSWREK